MYRNNYIDGTNRRSPEKNHDNIPLPKLPPLHTRRSFTENPNRNPNNPINTEEQANYQQRIRHVAPNSRNPDTRSGFSSTSTPSRHRRPPPPALPSTFTPPSSPRSGHRVSSQPRDPYNLPFVGETSVKDQLYHNISNNYDQVSGNKVYKSPFVGETDADSVPSSPIYQPNHDIKSDHRRHTPLSLGGSENNRFLSNNSEFLRNVTPGSYQSSSGTPIDNDIGFYNMPPPPLSNSRNISSISKSSDGVESFYSDSNYTFNNSSARHSSFNSVLGGRPLEEVPSITAPTHPFHIDLLDENKLYQCYSVYMLSDIYEWILKIYFEWFNEYVFGKIEFYQVVQRLLEFQMPNTFDQDIIDSNVDKIISSLVLQNAVRFERNNSLTTEKIDENKTNMDYDVTIIIGGLDIQGIFTELLPCYSFADTTYGPENTALCYSFTCHNRHTGDKRRDIKIADIIKKPVGLWTDYWHITSEELSEINPREIQRQSFIFDLIILEERSLNMANAAVDIYGTRFDPYLLPNEPKFASLAFDVFKPMIELHKEYLLGPIFRKIETKGKFIDGIGKIYSKWCSEAREPYLRYATSMATVHEVIRWEKDHQTKFATWLNEVDHCPEITRSKMYYDVIFFGGYFKSLQNMSVTLSSILKVTDPSMEDYDYLKMVIVDIEKLSSDVDKTHGDAIDRRKLTRFAKQLTLNTNSNSNTVAYVNVSSSEGLSTDSGSSQDRLDLGLDDPDRKLLMLGKVGKKRELWLDPTPVTIALLDNYLLITELVIKNDIKIYKLIERPIPVDYLNLEKKRKHEEVQSLISSTTRESFSRDSVPSTPYSSVRPNLLNAASNVSRSLIATNDKERRTGISNAQPDESELSFKIRNTATNESFTFITSNLNEKEQWVKSIMESLKSNETNNNVLDFEVVSTQFVYSDKNAPVNLPVAPEGSEIDTALKQYEMRNQTNPNLDQFLLVTTIICTEKFTYEGKVFVLVATTNGILVRLEDDIEKNFVKVIQCCFVRRMEINQKLGLLFLLDDRNLCYFNIPSIFGAYYDHKKYLSNNLIVGIVLKEKVGFFKLAEDFGNSKHLFYERKGKIILLTPEFDHLTKTFKYFKEYKEYKLPVGTLSGTLSKLEILDIVIFKKCFIICTSKGTILFQDSFNDEGINLPTFLNDSSMDEYSSSWHIGSNLFSPTIESSSKKDSSKRKMAEYVKRDIITRKTKPITCFQLNDDKTFLIIYDEAVVKINCHGEVPDWTEDILILDFYCTGACYFKGHLILIGDSLIQIYNLRNPNVKLGKSVPNQIIKGKKVMLMSSERKDTFTVVLSHPNIASRQLLLTCNVVDS